MNQSLPNTSFPSPTPANPWVPQTVKICKITPEIHGVATYHLALTDPAAASGYRFQPGQFNMLYLPGAGEAAISLSGDPASCGTLAQRSARQET